MNILSNSLHEQYTYVKDARSVLFDYCKTIALKHFIFENSSFGNGGSIRNLLVHTANSYRAWIGIRVLEKQLPHLQFQDFSYMDDIITLYATIDEMMSVFFDQVVDLTKEIRFEKDGHQQCATPLKIYSHVTTHEFHHKGQILSMSRHLGYTPEDTDIMR